MKPKTEIQPQPDYEIESIRALSGALDTLKEIQQAIEADSTDGISEISNLIRAIDDLKNTNCEGESDPNFKAEVMEIKAALQQKHDQRLAEAEQGNLGPLHQMSKVMGTVQPPISKRL